MFFLHFPGMVEQIKKVKIIKTGSADINVSGRNTKSHTSKHDQMNNVKIEQRKKINKTFQFSLGYLLLGFQLKTLEDFFMELFNYLYFTCQKKNKIKVTNIE